MAHRDGPRPTALLGVQEIAALLASPASATIVNAGADTGSAQTGPSFSSLPHTISYAADLSWLIKAGKNPAISCVITAPLLAERCPAIDKPLILHERPAEAFHLLHNLGIHRRTYGNNAGKDPVIAASARVHRTALLEGDVHVEEEAEIGPYTVVSGPARIGRGTRIEQHCVIGADGLFAKQIDNRLVSLTFFGGVLIGGNCHIHARSSVVRSPYFRMDTCLEDGVSLGVSCNVGHDCQVGRGATLSSQSLLCGRAVVGPNCWVGAGAIVRDAVEVGAGARVRLGAVVVQNVTPGGDVSGNFARDHAASLREVVDQGRRPCRN